MRKVHTAESVIEIAHLRNLLESDGIPCEVRNDRLGSVVGEDPVRRVLAGAVGPRRR